MAGVRGSGKSKKGGAGKKPEPVAEDTNLYPSANLVKTLVKEKRGLKAKISDLAKPHGDAVKAAINDKHLDRRALNTVAMLDKLEDEQLAITYHHILRYMDDLKIPERAKAGAGFFEEEETGGAHVGNSDNVRSIGDAARRVADQAGA